MVIWKVSRRASTAWLMTSTEHVRSEGMQSRKPIFKRIIPFKSIASRFDPARSAPTGLVAVTPIALRDASSSLVYEVSRQGVSSGWMSLEKEDPPETFGGTDTYDVVVAVSGNCKSLSWRCFEPYRKPIQRKKARLFYRDGLSSQGFMIPYLMVTSSGCIFSL